MLDEGRARQRFALASGASVIQSPAGDVQCLVEGKGFALGGASPLIVRDVLSVCDGQRDYDAALSELGSRHPRDQARAVFDALIECGVLRASQAVRAPSLLILGNHLLLDALGVAAAEAGYGASTRVYVRSFAHETQPAFRDSLLSANKTLAPRTNNRTLDAADLSNLVELLSGFDVAICALEGVAYQALLEVNLAALRSNVPCLFVTETGIGPVTTAGAGACFACWLLTEFAATNAAPWLRVPSLSPEATGRAAVLANTALNALNAADRASTTLRLAAGQPARSEPLLSHPACPVCRESSTAPLSDVQAAAIVIGRTWPVSPLAQAAPNPNAYRTVGIVGGGTAGFLAALALRKLRPELEVTLIESSAIPVIGVGEATTPELVKFLHAPRFLDLDVVDLYHRVRPTWKLGIKFEFGPKDFTFPFQRGRLLESKVYEGDINSQSLGSLLMQANKGPVFRGEDGHTYSQTHLVRWAYHLENRRFVRYLHEEARAAGVEMVDARITGVERSTSAAEVAALVTEDGRKLSYDLYLDCSGFRSLLLEQTLGSNFSDWSSTLFNDRALIAVVPHDGSVKPYTVAETMNAGWCWNIPFEDEDHRGYVFSSRFMTPEQAEAEMRAKNPGMGDTGLVKFRSGRHAEFWKGNVIALGNSYGFVEPLESTAIHMIVLTLELLTSHFPSSRNDEAVKAALNRKVAARWDALRWFLGTHFRHNRRLDTDYWRTANAEADVSGALERIQLFQERAPLSYKSSLYYTVFPPEYFSDDHSFDTILSGVDVPARYLTPVEDKATWQRRLAVLQRMQGAALPHGEALRWLREERPDELSKLRTSPESWLHTWVPA